MHLSSYHCVLCVEQVEESLRHLFFVCPFSQAIWIYLGITWDIDLSPLDMIITARELFGSAIFGKIIIIAAWCLWCHRNSIIFDNMSLSFAAWHASFVREMKLVTLRAKPIVKDLIDIFLSSL